MKEYRVTITGTQPLIMHADNIEWADQMEAWRADKENKKISKAGDDRSPAFRWLGCLYHDGARIVIPTENIMRALMEGGAMVPVPGARSGKTFRAQSQSGIIPTAIAWPLLVDGREIPFAPLGALANEPDFAVHKAAAEKLGFALYIKRAKIGQSKHVRVRPRFDRWAATGALRVIDPQITRAVLEDILECAGRHKGLGDWRPSSRTPGTFGTFEASIS